MSSPTEITAGWDGSTGRFTDEQYQRAAAACDPASKGSVKERCFLPHHDPGGALNRAGLAAAAQRVGSLAGRSPEAVARAKAHLRGHYNSIGEKPPPGLAADTEGETVAEADAVELGGKPNKGTKKDKRLHENNDTKTGLDMVPNLRGPIIVEGKDTGDRRHFMPGSVEWVDPKLTQATLQWQKSTSHGGSNDETVAVGRFTRFYRNPDNNDEIVGEARFGDWDDAVEAQNRNHDGFLTGVSIVGDDVADADIEYVYGDDGEADSNDADGFLRALMGAPQKVIYHHVRIRGATLVDVPALVEAQMHAITDGEPASPIVVSEPTVHAAVEPHSTALSNDAWDELAEFGDLHSVLRAEVAREAFAWVDPAAISDGGNVHVSRCAFLHHEVDRSGDPLAASTSACLSLLTEVHNSPIPDVDKPGVYRHLAGHLADAGVDVPPYEPQHSLTAAAWADNRWTPPAAWFQDPRLTVPTPIIVTNAGRVYGLATEWKECHIGMRGECVLPPREEFHGHFLTGAITCDDGRDYAVGQITAGIGHAPMHYGANKAAEHYDNTEAAIADVVVGNCRAGIWVAGAIRPWAQAERVHALRASGEVSPDWRRIGGRLRMVGLLTVNVSGYQVPAMAASGALEDVALARVRIREEGGYIQTLIASGLVSVTKVHPEATIGADDKAALREVQRRLHDRVHGNGKE